MEKITKLAHEIDKKNSHFGGTNIISHGRVDNAARGEQS